MQSIVLVRDLHISNGKSSNVGQDVRIREKRQCYGVV